MNYVLYHCCKPWISCFMVCKINRLVSPVTWSPSISAGHSSMLTSDKSGNTVVVSCYHRTWCIRHTGREDDQKTTACHPNWPKRSLHNDPPSLLTAGPDGNNNYVKISSHYHNFIYYATKHTHGHHTWDCNMTHCHWRHQLMYSTGTMK